MVGDLVSVFMGNLRLLEKLLDSHSDGRTLDQILSGTDVKVNYIVLSCTKVLSSGLRFLRNIPAEFAPLWVLSEPSGLPAG